MFTERQQQIIESAVILIAEKGIQNLTMKNLSKAIGITEPGIYRHFRNKFEVIKNILVYFRIQMKPAIDELEKEENCIDCIVNFITAQLKILSSNHHLAKVNFAEANFQNEEEFKNIIFQIMNNTQKNLTDKIIAAQQAGEVNNRLSAVNLTRIIIGSMRFLVTQWVIVGNMFDIENEGSKLCNDLRKIMEVER